MAWLLRRTKLFLLAIPIVMSMKESAFIDAYHFLLRFPGLPVALNYDTLLLIVLTIAYILFKHQSKSSYSMRRRIKGGLTLKLIIIFIAYSFIQVLIYWVGNMNLQLGLLFSLLSTLFPFLTILLWLQIMRFSTDEDLLVLINSITLISVILGILYILNSSGLEIYPFETYWEFSTQTVTIIRDFNTIPPWLSLSFATLLIRNDLRSGLGLVILVIVVIFTYTRSILLSYAGMFVVYLFIVSNYKKILKKYTVLAFLFAIFFFIFGDKLADNIDFFGGRFDEVSDTGIEESSFGKRLDTIEYLFDNPSLMAIIFGKRANVQEYDTGFDYSGAPTSIYADSTWSNIIYFSGIVGFMLLVLIYITTIIPLLLPARGLKRNQHQNVIIVTLTMFQIILVSFAGLTLYFQTSFVIAYLIHSRILREPIQRYSSNETQLNEVQGNMS